MRVYRLCRMQHFTIWEGDHTNRQTTHSSCCAVLFPLLTLPHLVPPDSHTFSRGLHQITTYTVGFQNSETTVKTYDFFFKLEVNRKLYDSWFYIISRSQFKLETNLWYWSWNYSFVQKVTFSTSLISSTEARVYATIWFYQILSDMDHQVLHKLVSLY